MAVSFSECPHGVGKTDPVSASQLAWCGAVTASPSSAQCLSLSHSLLVCCSIGQAEVHSFLVSLSGCFCDCQTLPSTLKPQSESLSLFPIQGCDSVLYWSHHSSSCSSCLSARPVSPVIVLLAQRHSFECMQVQTSEFETTEQQRSSKHGN